MSKLIKILVFVSGFSISLSNIYGQSGEQQNIILLHGVVLDATNQQALSNVHYLVNSSSAGSSTLDGKFSMYIGKTDTVVFSHLGYTDFYLSLSDTLKGKSFVAAIFMESDTLSIGEVVVIPRLGDLRSEFRTTNIEVSQELLNAKNNLEIATYQGLNSQAALGDPSTNYEIIKRKQIITASELGGIPSDQMLGLNFITIIPAAIYLLANGIPEKPSPPTPHISPLEMNRMIEIYKQKLKVQEEKMP